MYFQNIHMISPVLYFNKDSLEFIKMVKNADEN